LTAPCKAHAPAKRDRYGTAANGQHAMVGIPAGHGSCPDLSADPAQGPTRDVAPSASIVHAAPTASKAAAPSLRDASGTFDPADTTRSAASTRKPEGSRHSGRADWPVARGGVKVGLTVNRLRPDRPPVCRIRAKVPAAAITEAAYAQLTGMITAGECLPLKGFECGFESHRGHPRKRRLTSDFGVQDMRGTRAGRHPLTRVITSTGQSGEGSCYVCEERDVVGALSRSYFFEGVPPEDPAALAAA
jgi:hypothetical protein